MATLLARRAASQRTRERLIALGGSDILALAQAEKRLPLPIVGPFMTDRIVIIGAGQAGAQAVASLRAEGYQRRAHHGGR